MNKKELREKILWLLYPEKGDVAFRIMHQPLADEIIRLFEPQPESSPTPSTPIKNTEDELKQALHFYGDVCGQHQSMVHFGKYDVTQRNEAIRESAEQVLKYIEANYIQRDKVIEAVGQPERLSNLGTKGARPNYKFAMARNKLRTQILKDLEIE